MKATLYVNNRNVGSLEYALPRDEDGKTIPLPAKGLTPGDVSVEIVDESGENRWFAVADLLKLA